MPPLKDLTGQQFHRLHVLSRAPEGRRVLWRCRCACGVETILSGDRLTRGKAHSCGCWRREQSRQRLSKPKPQPGDRFGRLTILQFVGTDSTHPVVDCRCDCGTICSPQWGNVRSGATTSCGCARRQITQKRSTTHGRSKSREYRAWSDMISRCTRERATAYSEYGAKGITVCERWLNSFEDFYADLGPQPTPKHTLDRIKNELGYDPSNCRWATRTVQRENQRRTVLYTHHGVTGTLKALARHFGISYSAVHQRMTMMHWSLEDSLSIPTQHRRSPTSQS